MSVRKWYPDDISAAKWGELGKKAETLLSPLFVADKTGFVGRVSY